MATLNQLAGQPANVTVAGRTLTLSPVAQREEIKLWKFLAGLATSAKKERAKQLYEIAMLAPTINMQNAASARVIEMCAPEVQPNGNELEAVRVTMAGVVRELYIRTRPAHPELTEKEISALVSDANAEEWSDAIKDAIEEMDAKKETRSV